VVASAVLVTLTAGSTLSLAVVLAALVVPVVPAGVVCARAWPAQIASSEIATGVSRECNERALARRVWQRSMVIFIVAGKFSA
jgi:hypothetical protein